MKSKERERKKKDFPCIDLSEEESALLRMNNLPRPKAPPKLSISSPGVQREEKEKKFVIR